MIAKRIFLEEGNPEAWIDAYIADPVRGFTRRAMLVIPGGGYGAVCSDREGEPIALAFMAEGFNAFVLHYTVGRKKPYPAQLREASLAMAHIRSHAEEYGIDPARVFTVGFSAGGHLAGSLAVMHRIRSEQAGRRRAGLSRGLRHGVLPGGRDLLQSMV